MEYEGGNANPIKHEILNEVLVEILRTLMSIFRDRGSRC